MKYVLQSFFSYRTTVFDRVQAWIAASAAGIFNSKTLININYQAVSQSLNDFEARLLAQHRFLVKICPYASLMMMLCFSIGQRNILMATKIIKWISSLKTLFIFRKRIMNIFKVKIKSTAI